MNLKRYTSFNLSDGIDALSPEEYIKDNPEAGRYCTCTYLDPLSCKNGCRLAFMEWRADKIYKAAKRCPVCGEKSEDDYVINYFKTVNNDMVNCNYDEYKFKDLFVIKIFKAPCKECIKKDIENQISRNNYYDFDLATNYKKPDNTNGYSYNTKPFIKVEATKIKEIKEIKEKLNKIESQIKQLITMAKKG